jgi:hypothetical protein
MALEGAESPPVIRSTSYSFLRNRTDGNSDGPRLPAAGNRIGDPH